MIGTTTIVHRAEHTYCSHPCVAKLANGDWLVAFAESVQRDPLLHPPSDPRFHNLIVRSRDGGRTWELPRVAPGYDWYGVETPGIAQLSSGDVLLNQWRFLWYPVEQARRLWSSGEREMFVCEPGTQSWRLAHTEDDWRDHPHPWARADGGAYVHISADDGYTWDVTVPIEIAPYQGAFSPKGAVELVDGSVVLALGSQEHDPLAASFVVRSHDGGRTWGPPIEAARAPGLVFSEPSLVATDSGKLLLFSREETTGHVFQSESLDSGETWSAPGQLQLWGYPTHAVRLGDGRILITYGVRREPFGIRAALSEDEGRTWSAEIVIRDDFTNDNLGYPSTLELAPGEVFVVYYGEDDEGVTCIQGSYVALDDV